ncbi:MAG: HAMP domain-containing histidine kinase [Methanospirillum sp.]|uniref:sensor histidine kinase n=1 Tax=Methanospirillum sp. TaxID=45200 RepID=UPI00236998FC|nr:HAMP domain-containing sensor histidine kinase [Methanospirillum sp.]MDD1727545.1 HAMP domain-containing histidine kinase [Methanospirillum sp.]
MNRTNTTLKRKLTVLLFILILLSTASAGIGVGIYSYQQNVALIENTIQSVQQETQDRTEAFFLILAGAEPSIDLEMSSGLPTISKEIIALHKPVTLITPEDLIPIAERNNVDGIYLINTTGVIFTTTYPGDMGFDLKRVGLESFLQHLMNAGNISLDRAAVNALNGEITKYAYYSQPGSNYIIETSVQLRKALSQTRSQDFNSFLMDEFLPRIQQENPFVLDVDLFSSNTLSQYSLVHEGRKMDPDIYRQACEKGEVRYLSDKNLTVYTHFRPKEKEADYTGNLTSKVVYDVSMPGQILFETAWHTLVILILVTLIAFLVFGRLFDRLILRRLDTLNNGLQQIGEGDYSARIDESGDDEFSQIARELNRMSGLILAREEELKQLNRDQEEIVRQRTAELRQAKEAYELANIKLKMLSGITRHDILNQITGLSGFLDRAMREVPPGKICQYIRECKSIAGIIQNQIQFTQVYENIGTHDPVWQSIREIVQKAIRDIPGNQLILNLELDGILVLADPLFEKVFYTFIENTLRHGDHATHVAVSCEGIGTELVIIYEDNGIGIDEDTKSKIFRKGFGKNTGFGLFIAQEILAITHLTVRETGVFGKGVRFEILVKDGFWKQEHRE